MSDEADLMPMDLSKLLGDLYETDEDGAPADPPPAAAQEPPYPGPEWADEARLDEAFAEWRPGPPDDAPAAEREMANGLPTTSYPGLEAALASHDPVPEYDLTEGGMAESDLAADEPMIQGDVPYPDPTDLEAADALDPIQPRLWTRADDDVLPRRRGGRKGRRLSLLRR